MDSSAFASRSASDVTRVFFYIGVFFSLLALWKLVDIVLWISTHINITFI